MTREQLETLIEYMESSTRKHVCHILAVSDRATTARELEVKCNNELNQARHKLYAAFRLDEWPRTSEERLP